jgi:hypothetical protein
MIFKDHVQWPSQSEADQKEFAMLKKELQDKIGRRWPVSLKWHPSKVKRITDTDAIGGYRIEKPPESLVDLQWTALGVDKMPHVWTYCDNYEPDPITKKNKYYPTSRPFSGYETFPEEKLELVLWMFIAYPNLQGGRNESKSQNEIVFDLPYLDKIKSNEYDTLYGQVLALITNPQFGKPIDELKVMLTSYFVPGVEKMEDYEVRSELKRKAIEGSTPDKQMESMKLFLSRDQNAEGTKVRFLCQKAIEAGLIKYVSKRNVWVTVEGGQDKDVICKVQPEQINEKDQHLFETMAARITPENRELLQLLEMRFLGKDEEEKATFPLSEDPEENIDEGEKIIVEQTPKRGNPAFGKKNK